MTPNKDEQTPTEWKKKKIVRQPRANYVFSFLDIKGDIVILAIWIMWYSPIGVRLITKHDKPLNKL